MLQSIVRSVPLAAKALRQGRARVEKHTISSDRHWTIQRLLPGKLKYKVVTVEVAVLFEGPISSHGGNCLIVLLPDGRLAANMNFSPKLRIIGPCGLKVFNPRLVPDTIRSELSGALQAAADMLARMAA
jgi:hypothetical protein